MKEYFKNRKLIYDKKIFIVRDRININLYNQKIDYEKLELQDFNKKNSFVKEIKIKKLVDKIDSYSEIDTEKAWEILEAKYQGKNKKPVFLLNILYKLEKTVKLTTTFQSKLTTNFGAN